MLFREQCNLAVCSLDQARLARAPRRTNSAVHDRFEPGVCLSNLLAFPSRAITSLPDIVLDEIDVVENGIEYVFLRRDRELAAIKFRH